MLEARLLGRFDVRVDGVAVEIPSRPAQSLFAYLLLNAGTPHRRERLAGLLWPESAEESARSNLRHALWRIRRSLETAGSADQLAADDLAVTFAARSTDRIDAVVIQAERTGTESADALRERVSAYGGELLPGFYDEWVILERERIKGIFERTMQEFLDQLVRDERWSDVAQWAEHWISVGQSPEPAFRAVMTAAAAAGDIAGVATAYRRCIAALKSDLGVVPSPQTTALYERLSKGESPVRARERAAAPARADLGIVSAPAPGPAPYKGLRYYDESDATRFFGRDELVGRLITRVRASRFVAIVGASGSGKSSLLRAGVVPALYGSDGGRQSRVYVLTPTARPLESLAIALARGADTPGTAPSLADSLAGSDRSLRMMLAASTPPNVDSYVVVDQFEELFTECHDESERRGFVENLLSSTGAEGARAIVVTLRADFYEQCARYAGLRDLLAAQQEYIGPMTAEELRHAIEGPARQGGWEFEPGLVDLILRDMGDEPGALPLLSHALLETWQRRSGRTMTLRGYAESGGVRGAIARTADVVYNQQLSGEEREVAKGIFLRLAGFGDGSRSTRSRVLIRDLAPDLETRSTVDRVLRILTDARLVSIGVDSVEVAHEALFREWPALRQWLNDDRDGMRIHRHLSLAAQEWDETGREGSALYRGARLGQTLDWSGANARRLNALEREFLDASSAEANREVAEREARQRKELEDQRHFAAQLRKRAYMLSGAFVIALVLAVIAIFFGEQARASAAAAEFEQQRALLESSRSAAASIESRLGALRDAMNSNATGQLVFLAQTSDPSLQRMLYSMASFGGDVVLLFMSQSQTIEYTAAPVIVAPVFDRPERVRAERARDAVSGSAQAAAESCRRLQQLEGAAVRGSPEAGLRFLYMSTPYAPASGDAPSVAMIRYIYTEKQFRAQCVPYALVAEESLRRAGEWMASALAPGNDAYLVDQAGRLLARARRSDIEYFQDLSASGIVAAGLASPEAFLRRAADPLDGTPRLVATAPVGETGWRVLVVRSVSSSEQVDMSLETLGVVGGLLGALIVAVFAAALMVRRRRRSAGIV